MLSENICLFRDTALRQLLDGGIGLYARGHTTFLHAEVFLCIMQKLYQQLKTIQKLPLGSTGIMVSPILSKPQTNHDRYGFQEQAERGQSFYEWRDQLNIPSAKAGAVPAQAG